MLYYKEGMPEEDEIVLCKVTKIFPSSVFVELLEFNKQGMVHISEISPGRKTDPGKQFPMDKLRKEIFK